MRWMILVILGVICFGALFYSFEINHSDRLVKEARTILASGIEYSEVEGALQPLASKQYQCEQNFDDSHGDRFDVYVFGSEIDRFSENIIVDSVLENGVRQINATNRRHFTEDGYSYASSFGHCELTRYGD